MNLKFYRKRKNLTQEDMAKLLNVAPSTYRGYEANTSEPTIESLKKMSNYLDVSLDELCENQLKKEIYIPLWKYSDEQKANLYLIEQLTPKNNMIATGYLMRLLQEQQATGI